MAPPFKPPISTQSIILLLVVSTIIATAESESTDLERDCAGKWIHIRQLPPRFTVDLLPTCNQYPLYEDFCPHTANHGLGQKTHNQSHSWYRTDPSMLELIFHRRMLDYPCLTSDPSQANAVFLPYFSSIDALRYLYGPDINSSFEHGLELYRFLRQHDNPSIWERHSGHDHFLVVAGTAWDFNQPLTNDPPIWGTSFLELPEFYNVTALILESRSYPWQEQAVPYPTSFHPPNYSFFESWMTRVRRSRRTTMMLFAGGGGISSNPNIRRSIRFECDNNTQTGFDDGGLNYSKICEFVDCSNGICEHDPLRFMKPMLKATFCLQPPGDTPTRRSTFDGILAGCIPVFFEELAAKKQYGWHMPEENYDDFSVHIPKEDVVFEGLSIVDVLRSIPKDRVRRMRQKVLELIPRIIYRRHGNSMGFRNKKDAFDIAIEGTIQKITSRLEDKEVYSQ